MESVSKIEKIESLILVSEPKRSQEYTSDGIEEVF
jgi:hypothetical protein